MFRYLILANAILLFAASCSGRENARALIFKGGISHYFDTSIGSIGGEAGTSRWNVGPLVGVGVQFPRSEAFSLLLMVDFSSHTFKPYSGMTVTGNPKAEVVDLSLSAKYGADVAYVVGGLGYSVAHRDDAKYVGAAGYAGEVSGGDDPMFFLNLGLGGQFDLSSSLSGFVQGSFHLRKYSSLALETGIAWKF